MALISYWIFAFYWVRRELSRAFFNASQKWWVGAPVSLGSVFCEFSEKEINIKKVRVSAIDRDGAFLLFSPDEAKEIKKVLKKKPIKFRFWLDSEFSFSESFETSAKWVSVWNFYTNGFWVGLGIRFFPKDLANVKNRDSILSLLKGRGFIS